MFASGTEFDKSVSIIVNGAKDVKTVTFPSTIRAARSGAFSGEYGMERPLESVVLNEGLERLGACRSDGKDYNKGIFGYTKIERITLPSTLKWIEYEAFYDCKDLKSVEIQSGVKYVGEKSFMHNGIWNSRFQARSWKWASAYF